MSIQLVCESLHHYRQEKYKHVLGRHFGKYKHVLGRHFGFQLEKALTQHSATNCVCYQKMSSFTVAPGM